MTPAVPKTIRPRTLRRLAGLAALACALARAAPGPDAEPLPQWRTDLLRVRKLAENNVPLARAQAHALEAAMPPGALPQDQARIANLLARIAIYQGNTPEARAYASRAFDLARASDDAVGQAEADLNLALNAINTGDIDELAKRTTHSMSLVHLISEPGLAGEIWLRTSMMYRRTGQVEESVRMCVHEEDLAERSGDALALTYAHQCMALSYDQSANTDQALAHFRAMGTQARIAGSTLLEAYAVTGTGALLARTGDPRQGEERLREGIGLFRAVGAQFGTNFGTHMLATHLIDRQRYAEAVPLLDAELALYERYANRIGLWYTLATRSRAYEGLHDVKRAHADVQRGYALAKAIGRPQFLADSAARMAAIAAAAGDYPRAYALSDEALRQSARANLDKIGTTVVDTAQRYEAERRRRQIDDLTRKNQEQTAELANRALQQRWLWTVLGGSLLILAGTAFFLVRLRRSHAIIASLNTTLEQRVRERTAELRQQARYLRTLVDALPLWVWLKDTSHRYLALNDAAARQWGHSATAMLGKSDLDVRPPAQAAAFVAEDRAVMAARTSKTVEELQVIQGEPVWLETFRTPVLDEDGTVLGTVGFSRDISERKASEMARETALAEAQRLARLRSDFLAQMNHELRTPLNGILGYAQILQRDPTLGERQRMGLDVIRQSGEDLLALINDVLDLGKIEAGKLAPFPTDVPVDAFLQRITQMFSVKAEQKQLAFACEATPGLPAVMHVDAKRLRQTLLNLLDNAVKFTERGSVRLQVSFTPPQRFRFAVHDTGIGIAPGAMERIFRPYEQVGDLQHRLAGTGLGLTISRQFVRSMGGEIQVDSRPGAGTTFWFELDLPHGPAARTPARVPDQPVSGYAGPRRTVLVADDELLNRMVALDMLGALGFSTAVAVNGAEALDQAHATRPDLVLMDIVMPELDGVEATRRLRADPALAHVPVIGMSVNAHASDEQQCHAAGMDAFLAKPIALDRLLEALQSLLGLTWTVAATAPADEAATPAPLHIPPPPEMAHLRQLARAGNMHDILLRADHLSAIDGRYRAFAGQLRALAANYQSAALTQFVERHSAPA